jgi:hypothetical protein
VNPGGMVQSAPVTDRALDQALENAFGPATADPATPASGGDAIMNVLNNILSGN